MLARSIRLSAIVRQSSIAFVAALSAILSFWLTLRFFEQLCPHESRLELLAMGTLWESAKMVFGAAGARAWVAPGQRLQGAFLLGLAAILAGGSIVASFGFVTTADAHGRTRRLTTSAQYQRAQGEWQTLQSQITLLTEAAQQDMAQGFRSRGLKILTQVDALRAQGVARQKDMLAMEVTGHTHDSTGISDGAHEGLSSQLRLTGQGILAAMLELIGLTAMALLSGSRQQTQKTNCGGAPPSSPTVSQPRQLRCVPNHVSAALSKLPQTPPIKRRYDDVRQQVIAAQLSPSYQALQAAFRISQSTAQRYLRRLREEGIVRQGHHGYALVQTQAIGGAQ